MCLGCSEEPSRDGSFEYPQHMFWLRNKKNNFQLRSLIWGPGVMHMTSKECEFSEAHQTRTDDLGHCHKCWLFFKF